LTYKEQYNTSKNIVWTEENIEKHLPLVKRIAGKIAISLPAHIDEEDLLGYGVFGLLDALQRFDPSRGVKFETYANLRIRGAMIDGLRSMDWVPHSARQKVKQLYQNIAQLENTLGRTPSLEETAQYLKMSLEELNTVLLQGQYMTLVSLEDVKTTDSMESNISPLDLIIDPQAQELFNQIEKEEQKQILMGAIEKLSEKEKTVIALYYREDMTLKEIAAVMKLSESRISQIHSQAILRLRGYLGRQKKYVLG
jgi:RNA polymerase sigma factor for flagellar operon FliA